MVNQIFLPGILQPFQCDNLYRLGKHNDGGYLVNYEDILKTQTLISFGIGKDISFEDHFYKIKNCQIILYDRKIEAKNINENYKIFSKNIVHDIDIIDVFDNLTDVFLKCDIEGDEYLILDYLIENYNKFIGAVIEFHGIEHNNNLLKLFNFITKFRHPLVHLHVNNYFYYITESNIIPSVVEVTFTNSKNLSYNKKIKLPHRLDMKNNNNGLDFLIDFIF